MLTYYWPCIVTQDRKKRYHVRPANLPSCEGTGLTRVEAQEACGRALQACIDAGDIDSTLELTVQQEVYLRDTSSEQFVRVGVVLPR